MDLSYILNHLGEERERYFNAVAPPIIQSSNFCFGSVAEMRSCLTEEYSVPFYTRGANPTVAILRKKLAALCKAEDCLVFSSGIAAISAAVISQMGAGQHAICVAKPYSWTNHLFNELLPRYGVSCSMIDANTVEAVEQAIQENTSVIFLESPNTMTFELQPLAAIAKLAKSKGITTIIDNSYASPLGQHPIELGIDIEVHSASKYISGHSDVVAGVLCSSRAITEKVFHSEYMTLGSIISPHDAWLMIRSLRTLPLRMQRTSESTKQVVEFLEGHPKVKKVYYPFSKAFEQSKLAKKQMNLSGGLLSFELDVEEIEDIEAFCDRLQRFLLACSWGGHESLILPLCAVLKNRNKGETSHLLPWNLVRLYVGLEEPSHLIQDLRESLNLL